jgi:ribosomal subunit interface protein
MLPIQVTIKDIPATSRLETTIRQRAEKLSRYSDRIVSCRVVVESNQKHKHQGKLYNVRIDLAVPGKRLAITRKCNEDVYVAIRDAFNALGRQLEEHSRRQNGHVKAHIEVLHGHIVRMIPNEGYGFIEGDDGTEYYFSVTNVTYPNFNNLMIGDSVEYLAEPLSQGWQAHHVTREKNNHIVV